MNRCAICPDPILPTEETVELSAEPYRIGSGEAHKPCADEALNQALDANRSAVEGWVQR